MFWSLGHFNSAALDSILDREGGFTLDEILEEDDLLQECKAQNQKLLDFLVKPETIKALIAYITEMPPEDAGEGRSYKYPYVASELLSCDVPALRDVLF